MFIFSYMETAAAWLLLRFVLICLVFLLTLH